MTLFELIGYGQSDQFNGLFHVHLEKFLDGSMKNEMPSCF